MTAHRPEQAPAARVPVVAVAELLEAVDDYFQRPTEVGDRTRDIHERAFHLLGVLEHVRTAGVTADRLRIAAEVLRDVAGQPPHDHSAESGQKGAAS